MLEQIGNNEYGGTSNRYIIDIFEHVFTLQKVGTFLERVVRLYDSLNAVYDLVTEISNSLDCKPQISGLFLNLTKAFALVDHSLLITKLEVLSIRFVPLHWISSYLTQRNEVVDGSYINPVGCLRK